MSSKYKLSENSIVAVGSMGHEGSDAVFSVLVSRPGPFNNGIHQTLESILKQAVTAETFDVLDQDCEEGCVTHCEEHMPTLWTAAGEERLSFLQLSDQQIEELEQNGYIYL